jgi:hypothetical protein
MRMTDVILEDEQADEGILGGLVGAAKGLLKGAPMRGYRAGDAQSQGLAQVKKTADSLYKDFFKQMGTTGQQPNGNNLIAYLTSKQYPVKMAQAVINAQVKARATTPQGNATTDQVEPTLASNPPADDSQTPSEAPAVLKPNPARGQPSTGPAVIGPNPARRQARDQALSEARGYTIALDANTAYKAILAAAQENLRMNRATTASSSPASGGGNTSSTGSTANMSSGTAGNSLTADTIMRWFESQNQGTRANLLTMLNLKHEELNKKSATATPTAEGYSRFLARDL